MSNPVGCDAVSLVIQQRELRELCGRSGLERERSECHGE